MSIALANSPADILRWYLVSAGQGSNPTPLASGNTALQWPLLVAAEPSFPDNCITLYDTAPVYQGRLSQGDSINFWGIQVRVRGVDFPTAQQKAWSLKQFLDEQLVKQGVAIDGHNYCIHSFDRSNILSLGADTPTSKRYLFTINGIAYIEEQ